MKARVAMALLCGVLLAPLPASAESGFASVSLNLRAGPGTAFPVLLVIPAGARLDIVGCLAAYDWCDVAWGNNRGWVAGRYLQARLNRQPVPLHRRQPPVTAFDFPRYWDDHYRHRPFYQHRDRYQWAPGQPVGTSGNRTDPLGPPSDPNARRDIPCQPGMANCRPGRFN